MSQQCCECADHGIWATIPEDPAVAHTTELDATSAIMERYNFVDEAYTECDGNFDGGGSATFRMEAEGLPDLYLIIWNHHNGYYSHGFESWREEGSL
jgi:hypothetical protein